MKNILILLAVIIGIARPGYASAIELGFEWDAPADPSLVDGTRLYQTGNATPIGFAAMPANQVYIDMGDMVPGRYCFTATHTATDDGITHESGPSNEVCLRIPGKPEKLRVKK